MCRKLTTVAKETPAYFFLPQKKQNRTTETMKKKNKILLPLWQTSKIERSRR
ncbi:hypothetical protein HMPREF1981_03151 [Bacteroides pyogenes F0041]|uniref:Uncharacterized protein n=1 Tax=Bacteroides pyogenes F0041 TaxID=1321819 RepID=U2CBS8_9BACE|nr:hypothetical protein HMPREF1981_03151 [Bacteroides pyogenes F0041]GAE23370.1 hypothetical protein JCM10003_3123 [Bacteroides pyogenes JCM 10003]